MNSDGPPRSKLLVPSTFRLLSLSTFPVWARIKTKKIYDCGGAKKPEYSWTHRREPPETPPNRTLSTVFGRPLSHNHNSIMLNPNHNSIMFSHMTVTAVFLLKTVEDAVGHPHIQKTATHRTPYTPNHIWANPRGSLEYFGRRRRIIVETPLGNFRNVTQTNTVNHIQEAESQLNHVQSQSQLNHVQSVVKKWESELKTNHGYDGKAAKTQPNRTKKTHPNRIQKRIQPYSKRLQPYLGKHAQPYLFCW